MSDEIDSVHLAIGKFVVEWSSLEYCFDLLVMAARDRVTQNKLPHQLANKIVFLRASLDARPQLEAFREDINNLISEIETLAVKRHDYVHGAIIHMVESERPLTVTLHRLLQPKSKLRRAPVRVNARQIDLAAASARGLGDKVLDMAEAVNKFNKLN